MIKIEAVDGVCTIERESNKCVLFTGMIISPEEVLTIDAQGDIIYSIDEVLVVSVPKGTKATVNKFEVPAEIAAPVDQTTNVVEAAPVAEVVTAPVEVTTTNPTPTKK